MLHYTDSLVDEDLKARYELTRTTYAVLFKSKPPVEFWPAPSTPDCSNAGASFEKLDEKSHLSFLNEENLNDDDDDDDDTYNDEYYDEDESVDAVTVHGTNIFDMNPGALALAREFQASVKKSGLMSFFDS